MKTAPTFRPGPLWRIALASLGHDRPDGAALHVLVGVRDAPALDHVALLRVDAAEREDRVPHVADGRVVLVARPVHAAVAEGHAAADAAAGQRPGAGLVVVAALAAVDRRRAAELAADHDQ